MFGEQFPAEGRPVVPDYANTTKMIHPSHLCACRLAEFLRERTHQSAYGHDELEDPTVTLRVNAHRLRKYLENEGMLR